MVSELIQDFRYAARGLRKHPGFVFIAVIILALGIGSNITVFTATNALLLRPMDLPQPDQLVRLTSDGRVFSYPDFSDLRRRATSFTGLAAHSHTTASLSLGSDTKNALGEVVTGNYFAVLKVQPFLGRTLTESDDVSRGSHPVVVISYGLWKNSYGSDASVIGKTLHLNGFPFSIVGVMPERFRGSFETYPTDFWAPVMMQHQARPRGLELTERGWGWLTGTARLKPEITMSEANAELERIAKQLSRENRNSETGFTLTPARAVPNEWSSNVEGPILILSVIVALLLLVACADVASMLISRMMGRAREMAIRASIGAGHWQMARLWLAESLLLAFLGGLAGFVLCVWTRDALAAMLPADYSWATQAMLLDVRAVLFTIVVCLFTAVLCGLFPILRLRRNLSSVLKELEGAPHKSRMFTALIIVQVSISILLLVCSGLLLRTLRNSSSYDVGFQTSNLMIASADLQRNNYSETGGLQFQSQLLSRLRQMPGVVDVTYSIVTPLGSGRESLGFLIEGHQPPEGKSAYSIDYNSVGPDYFRTLGIPLVRGRVFDDRDGNTQAPKVAVINESMAARFWPESNPIGRSLKLPPEQVPVEIIGVVRDIKYYTLGEDPMPYVYLFSPQFYSPLTVFQVRHSTEIEGFENQIKSQARTVDPDVALYDVMSFEEQRRLQLFPIRLLTILTTFFSVLTLLLTSAGLYGLISFYVQQRLREIALRIALGAARKSIFTLFLKQGLKMTTAGMLLGLLLAVLSTKFLSAMLFRVSALDVPSFLGGITVLLIASSAACYLPAYRATNVNPSDALRNL